MASKYLSKIKDIYKAYAVAKDFSKFAGKCRILSASEGRVQVELDVTEDLMNPQGALHGGCTATLVDIVTTSALIATPRGLPGVSVDLTVSYLSGAKLGETIVVDGYVIRNGRTLAFTQASIYRKSDNRQIAVAQHTKAFPQAKS